MIAVSRHVLLVTCNHRHYNVHVCHTCSAVLVPWKTVATNGATSLSGPDSEWNITIGVGCVGVMMQRCAVGLWSAN